MPFDSSPLADWQQVLLRAADIVEKRGWCQNSYGRKGAPRCAYGALAEILGFYLEGNMAPPQKMLENEAVKRLLVALPTNPDRHDGDYDYSKIPYWNDDPTNTASNVANMMRRCALGVR